MVHSGILGYRVKTDKTEKQTEKKSTIATVHKIRDMRTSMMSNKKGKFEYGNHLSMCDVCIYVGMFIPHQRHAAHAPPQPH